MKNLHSFLKVFLFIVIILTIKSWLTTYFIGPLVIPDESCIIVKAKTLMEQGSFTDCEDLFHRTTGNPFPLYSIIIAPLYTFFKGPLFYPAILVFNAILISSLIFPLKKILQNISDKKSTGTFAIFVTIFVTLFTSQILIFEKTAMTETLFTVINIWALYFYLQSFARNKSLNKVIAIILAIASALTRPFGFVTIIAMALNEFILSNKKKHWAFVTLILLITITATLYSFLPNIFPILWLRIQTLQNPENIINLGKAIINQVNSLTFATYLIPVIMFSHYFFEEKNRLFKKIRFYLLFLCGGIFLISTQHLFGYFLEELPAGISTRYINLPIVLIIFFGLHFLNKKDKFELNNKTITITAVLAFFLIFMSQDDYSSGLNLDLFDPFFTKKILSVFFILVALLTIGLIVKARKALFISISVLILTQSAYVLHSFASHSNKGHFSNSVTKFFHDESLKGTQHKILYISRGDKFTESFWSLMSITDHHIDLAFFDETKQEKANLIDPGDKSLSLQIFTGNHEKNDKSQVENLNAADYAYIVTTLEVPGLPMVTQNFNSEFVYKMIPIISR